MHVEYNRDADQHQETRVASTSLDSAEICQVYLGIKRELLLTELLSRP